MRSPKPGPGCAAASPEDSARARDATASRATAARRAAGRAGLRHGQAPCGRRSGRRCRSRPAVRSARSRAGPVTIAAPLPCCLGCQPGRRNRWPTVATTALAFARPRQLAASRPAFHQGEAASDQSGTTPCSTASATASRSCSAGSRLAPHRHALRRLRAHLLQRHHPRRNRHLQAQSVSREPTPTGLKAVPRSGASGGSGPQLPAQRLVE